MFSVRVDNKPSLRVVRPRTRLTSVQGPTSLRACEEARRRDSSEHDQGNEAEETSQVRVNLLLSALISKEACTSTRAEGREPGEHRQLIARVQAQVHGSTSPGRQEGQ